MSRIKTLKDRLNDMKMNAYRGKKRRKLVLHLIDKEGKSRVIRFTKDKNSLAFFGYQACVLEKQN